ncbi:putative protein kinase domain, NAD(P)-binding domain superfamily [Plasmopara halstedii]
MPVVSVGFIGSGRLAECVARDLIKNVTPQRKFSYKKQRLVSTLLASDPSEERRRVFTRLGFTTTDTNQDVLADCDLVFLGTNVEELLCPGAKVIRMMPQSYLEKAGVPKGVLPPRSWATVRGSYVNDHDLEKVMRIAGINKSVEVDDRSTSWALSLKGKGPSLNRKCVKTVNNRVEAKHQLDNLHKAVGTDFNGTYKLGVQLGSGKFSTVYKAFNRKTGETVAVKVIENKTLTQEGYEELIAEVGALNRLKHHNIISDFGFYTEADKHLLVLEYCNQGSVRNMIDERKILSEPVAKEILKQMLLALNYCHSMGQVHRDIKAENVLLHKNDDASLIVKLADFGLSEELQVANNGQATICGTPQYLSPELVSGRLHGTPADIWSTGILAYMMLSGLVPFDEAKNDVELFKLISLGAVWYDQPQWNAVSPVAKQFVQSMLDVVPESRPSATELLKHEWFQDA